MLDDARPARPRRGRPRRLGLGRSSRHWPGSASLERFHPAQPVWLTLLAWILAAAIASAVLHAGTPLATGWLDVIGPSRIVALALIVNVGGFVLAALCKPRLAFLAAALSAFGVGCAIPLEYPALLLCVAALWLALRRHQSALPAVALAAVGLHTALYADRLSTLVTLALKIDAAAVATLIALCGRRVSLAGTEILVDDGVSLRLVEFCSSLWPLLTVVAAVATGMRLTGTPALRRAALVLLASAGLTVMLNWARLVGMSFNGEIYAWFHEGPGAALVRVLIVTTIIAALAGACVRPASAPNEGERHA